MYNVSYSGHIISDVSTGQVCGGGERNEDERGHEDHGLEGLGAPSELVHHFFRTVPVDRHHMYSHHDIHIPAVIEQVPHIRLLLPVHHVRSHHVISDSRVLQ